MWTFIVMLAVVFFVLAIVIVMVACLQIAGKEDEWLMRQMEEKSIENADVFVYDGELIGKVISVEEKDEEDKPIENDEEPIILGIDLAKEEEEKTNGLDNN